MSVYFLGQILIYHLQYIFLHSYSACPPPHLSSTTFSIFILTPLPYLVVRSTCACVAWIGCQDECGWGYQYVVLVCHAEWGIRERSVHTLHCNVIWVQSVPSHHPNPTAYKDLKITFSSTSPHGKYKPCGLTQASILLLWWYQCYVVVA